MAKPDSIIIEELLESFSGKESEIEDIMQNASASSLARFLYLKKLIDENDPATEKVKQETAFFTGNIPWYEFLISRLHKGEDKPSESSLAAAQPEEQIEKIAEETEFQQTTIGEKDFQETKAEDKIELYTAVDKPGEDLNESEPIIQSEPEKVISNDQNEQLSGGSESEKRNLEENPENAAETQEKIEQSAENNLPEAENQEQEVIKKEEVNQEIAEQTKTEIKESEPLIPLDPLHTVDYFASQGIKISEADFPDDKLTQQVKSFTGWLKSMKRLHGKLPEQDEAVERIIRNASEASNQESGVLTEAMAEVLVKQNKKDKAIELYEKLSLKNPSKSAYFAAKIENLKSN